ncbi:caspase family protein [Pelagimonas varians]|uniref:Caspase domain protein n=1 Tax=Pelagimonas varians TaxID=696760 RepID=A0A238L162_9RHOB|nr:caspase family protein [Pelagimonas varians]PYG27177.1 caspase domain-containing protein [Pelagimonas varians]SMX48600.1 Caspase domain protein [Pelagimonas varians]
MRFLSFIAGWVTAAALVTTPVFARENHALLIGASTYPNLDERFWLVGPANDVDLVRGYLTTNPAVPFDAENITVLADGVAGGQEPTLANIRTEMAVLATRLQPDDFVYLHFSGHGTQAPAQDPESELDGLDELFLPSDIGLWNDTAGSVQNALIDDEIGQMISTLRATGATVWAVFDSCHSGTVTRAANAGEDLRMRKLDPTALGVPRAALDQATHVTLTRSVNPRAQDEAPIDIPPSTLPDQGDFIAFFAAQSNESTPEKRLPRGKPGRRSQGVFTYTLFETLASNSGISYRQLGQEILRKYATERRAQSTPMFVGDLDLPVFDTGGASSIQQWPVTVSDSGALTLSAGLLHRLEPGERLALLAAPTDPISGAIGIAAVDTVDTFGSTLIAVEEDGHPAITTSDIPNGGYARRTEETVNFSMSIALPPMGSAGDTPARAALMQALDFAAAQSLMPPRVVFVSPADSADLQLTIDSARNEIRVLAGSGYASDLDIMRSPTITTTDKSNEQLALDLVDTFSRISKVQNLLKLGRAADATGLDVEVTLQTRTTGTPGLDRLETIPVPRLVPGDEVHILARNQDDGPVDLNLLYIGSDYSITHMFKGRLQSGDTLKQGLLRITADSFGRDRMMLFITPAETHMAVEDFGFLAQTELPVMRAAGRSFLAQSLIDAGFGDTLRAAVPIGAPEQSAKRPVLMHFDIDTRPLK